MEEVIQIVFFIAITVFALIKKYKEVQENHPKQTVQSANPSASKGNDTSNEYDDFEDDYLEDQIEEDEYFDEKNFDEKDFDEKDFDEAFNEEVFTINEVKNNELKDSPIKEEKATTATIKTIFETPQESFSFDRSPSFHPSSAIQPQSVPLQSSRRLKKEPLIYLKSRKEARKAFIYSEIFNRRYQ